jgi:60S ribosomal subunit assembly/export protein LOC1
MAPSKTSTVKNKHASKRSANGSGISNSKYSTRPQNDGRVSKTKPPPKTGKGTGKPLGPKKRRVYTEKELGIQPLNMITPVGVTKPKMGKKGKVFVDDEVRIPNRTTEVLLE